MQWLCKCGSRAREVSCRNTAAIDVSRSAGGALPVLAYARCGERLQLTERDSHRLLVRLDDATISANESRDGHGLGRGEREIVEHAAIGALMFGAIRSHFSAGGFVPQGESLAGLRMEILAQAHEFLVVCVARQSESLRTFANPLARDRLVLRVVIANGEVLLEILLGIPQTVLCFGREHDKEITGAGQAALASSG